jgi:hypothetical protein
MEQGLVQLLSTSGNLPLRLAGTHKPPQTTITNEKIKILMSSTGRKRQYFQYRGRFYLERMPLFADNFVYEG